MIKRSNRHLRRKLECEIIVTKLYICQWICYRIPYTQPLVGTYIRGETTTATTSVAGRRDRWSITEGCAILPWMFLTTYRRCISDIDDHAVLWETWRRGEERNANHDLLHPVDLASTRPTALQQRGFATKGLWDQTVRPFSEYQIFWYFRENAIRHMRGWPLNHTRNAAFF